MDVAVSIHAPTRGATRAHRPAESGCRVSIHAPTRGATRIQARRAGHRFVSIHAPTRGATAGFMFPNTARPFQFTRPRGARLARRCFLRSMTVSIHAPTRGATLSSTRRVVRIRCFNSRAHAGRDATAQAGARRYTRFNSRAHAGRDTLPRPINWLWTCFNSRAHAGRDAPAQ